MQVRKARQTGRLDEVVAFYRDGLGLPEIASFANHNGYDGVMLDLPGTGTHLEFASTNQLTSPTPHPEDLLVLYVGTDQEVARLLAQSAAPQVPNTNPYWERTGVTITDPDGFRGASCTRTT